MLERIKLRDFRCFEAIECGFGPGPNYIVGPNAQGKTSVLEAVSVLLRLQSPRTSRLGDCLRHGGKGLVVDGRFAGRHLQFYYSHSRRKLALDGVELRSARDYLRAGRAVWFGSDDVLIVRGGGEARRRFLDYLCAQIDPAHRAALREYDRALRSRNRLLRMPRVDWRAVSAFDVPLISAGETVAAGRAEAVRLLGPEAAAAQDRIGGGERIELEYLRGFTSDFASELSEARTEDARLGQTSAGPHRDDMRILIGGKDAGPYASEGQQRTAVLALRIGQAILLRGLGGGEPILLVDDVFGELDGCRREGLLALCEGWGQALVTCTNPLGRMAGRVRRLESGQLTPC